MNKQDRIKQTEEQYEAALAQAQAVPSGYTKRELKRADKARKLAALPTWQRVVPGVVLVGLFLVVGVSCGANAAARSTEVERCVVAQEAALVDAGSDRPLTAVELAACSDSEKRAFILGEGGGE